MTRTGRLLHSSVAVRVSRTLPGSSFGGEECVEDMAEDATEALLGEDLRFEVALHDQARNDGAEGREREVDLLLLFLVQVTEDHAAALVGILWLQHLEGFAQTL